MSHFRSVFLTSLLAGLLGGCTVAITDLDTSSRAVDAPAVGEIRTAELGERLVYQQDVEVVRGRKVEGVQRGQNGPFPVDMSGMYIRANGGKYYCGTMTLRDPLNNGRVHNVCLTDDEFRAIGVPFTDTEEIAQRPTNLQRILEYSGRDGQTLSVFYKEYTETVNGAFIRPAFTQEFKFDMREGPVIGVKGARIEVLEATNTGIEYKVVAHFPR